MKYSNLVCVCMHRHLCIFVEAKAPHVYRLSSPIFNSITNGEFASSSSVVFSSQVRPQASSVCYCVGECHPWTFFVAVGDDTTCSQKKHVQGYISICSSIVTDIIMYANVCVCAWT